MTLAPLQRGSSKKASPPDEPLNPDWVHARHLVTVRHVAQRMLSALAPLRRRGVVRAVHFQRKEPGLRWRIASADAAAVRLALQPVLERLCAPGQGVGQWHETVYEPEAHLFGGSAAMHVAHALFDAETRAWSELSTLRERGQLPYTDSVIALAQANELFAAALLGRPEEVWDSWCRLGVFHDLRPPLEGGQRSRPNLLTLSAHPQAEAARGAIRTLAEAQARAGAELCELAVTGHLTQGLRGVLAALALFNWNRVGLTTRERRHVLTQAMRAWHPHVAPLQPVAEQELAEV